MNLANLVAEFRFPKDRLQNPARRTRRHYVIADALDLELRPREAGVVAKNLNRYSLCWSIHLHSASYDEVTRIHGVRNDSANLSISAKPAVQAGVEQFQKALVLKTKRLPRKQADDIRLQSPPSAAR